MKSFVHIRRKPLRAAGNAISVTVLPWPIAHAHVTKPARNRRSPHCTQTKRQPTHAPNDHPTQASSHARTAIHAKNRTKPALETPTETTVRKIRGKIRQAQTHSKKNGFVHKRKRTRELKTNGETRTRTYRGEIGYSLTITLAADRPNKG